MTEVGLVTQVRGRNMAVFSNDPDPMVYRYSLHRPLHARPVGEDSRTIAWVMLNPSTADAFRNDPTVERVQRRSAALGFDVLCVLNLFAYRSTQARRLLEVPDPVGVANDALLLRYAGLAHQVVCAWGSFHPEVNPNRWRNVVGVLRRAHEELWCLGTTRAGHPRHPLYVPYSQGLVPFEPEEVA